MSIFGSDVMLISGLQQLFVDYPRTLDSPSSVSMPADSVPRKSDSFPLQNDSLLSLPNDSLLPLDSLMRRRADSIAIQADSIARLARSLSDSLKLNATNEEGEEDEDSFDKRNLQRLDSLKSLYGNSNATVWNDSVARAEDSIKATKKENPLDAPVQYTAKDSVVFYMSNKNAYLYGDAKVDYTSINLESEKIQMNMDSSIVHAFGVKDSLGNLSGTPIFKDGDQEYESETMAYNFKTRKGYIFNVYTHQEEGYITSRESKKGPDNDYYMKKGRYTTCDEPHPHFYIEMTRAKVRPGKDVVTGPAHLVVEDVPLPLAIPFAYFPFTSTYSSGIIMPSYGDEYTRGFYLRDGGYYFAINDHIDAKLTGEIYTKGSWGAAFQTTYNWRYKCSGNFYFNYMVTKEGEKNMPDYSEVKNFKLQWTHRQDPKSSPNSSFSASVNFTTQSYEKNNLASLYNPTSYSQSTRTSSLSYSRTFPKAGLSISTSMNISQNMKDSTIALTLPSLSISLSRLYPFKRKVKKGKERWYEKISMSYTGSLSNSITTKEDQLLKSSLVKDWKNGMKHSIPVSASFSILKYINVSPSFNFTDRMYSHKVNQSWDDARQAVVRDTVYGFYNVYDFNLSLSASTTLYGFFTPNRKIFGDKIQKIRHKFTPSLSFSYQPDFSKSSWGMYDTYTKTDLEGNVTTVEYSPYSGGMYGVPGKGMTGAVSLDVSNNVELKYKDKNDSIKKISIIDEIGANLSYNMAAKTQPWSNLSTRLRLKYGKFSLNLNAVFNTYAYEFDKNGNVIVGNRTEWSYGRFGRFQGFSKNFSYTFNNQSFRKIKEKIDKLLGKKAEQEEKKKEGEETEENAEDEETKKPKKRKRDGEEAENTLDEDGYMKFKMPWSFSISYGINVVENRQAEINIKNMRYPWKLTHNLNFSGTLKISSNWNISASSGWDFTANKLSMTTVNVNRDMHCFNISASFVFGTYTSYNVTLRANASTLTDALKYDKKSSYSSSVKWY